MSLWNKPISQITFDDIDGFCRAMLPEGARLEYKGIQFPQHLERSIAAFANTLGGLIILGVDADRATNMPIWPPQGGLPTHSGLADRVIQIAQDAIHPAVGIAVSNVIENRYLRGTALVVIRVSESREAPHAVENRRRVYVYERTANRNQPYELADIDRIEYLLARRKRLVDKREAALEENLERAKRTMHKSITPIRWMSISPVYPWRDVHDVLSCIKWHPVVALNLWRGAHWRYQSFIRGSFAVGHIPDGRGTICTCVSSVAADGTLFCATYAEEALRENQSLFGADGRADERPTVMMMDLMKIREIARTFLQACRSYYESDEAQRPGEVMVSVGIKNSFGLVMHDMLEHRKSDAPFPDLEFRTDMVMQVDDLTVDRTSPIHGIFENIKLAFNTPAVPLQ